MRSIVKDIAVVHRFIEYKTVNFFKPQQMLGFN